jgi:hypothetical protein
MVLGILPLSWLLEMLSCLQWQITNRHDGDYAAQRVRRARHHRIHSHQCYQVVDGAWNTAAKLVVVEGKKPDVPHCQEAMTKTSPGTVTTSVHSGISLFTHVSAVRLPMVLGILPVSWLLDRLSCLQCQITNRHYSVYAAQRVRRARHRRLHSHQCYHVVDGAGNTAAQLVIGQAELPAVPDPKPPSR